MTSVRCQAESQLGKQYWFHVSRFIDQETENLKDEALKVPRQVSGCPLSGFACQAHCLGHACCLPQVPGLTSQELDGKRKFGVKNRHNRPHVPKRDGPQRRTCRDAWKQASPKAGV